MFRLDLHHFKKRKATCAPYWQALSSAICLLGLTSLIAGCGAPPSTPIPGGPAQTPVSQRFPAAPNAPGAPGIPRTTVKPTPSTAPSTTEAPQLALANDIIEANKSPFLIKLAQPSLPEFHPPESNFDDISTDMPPPEPQHSPLEELVLQGVVTGSKNLALVSTAGSGVHTVAAGDQIALDGGSITINRITDEAITASDTLGNTQTITLTNIVGSYRNNSLKLEEP